VFVAGEDGIDPAIVLARAQGYALEADAQRAHDAGDHDLARQLRAKHFAFVMQAREEGAARSRRAFIEAQAARIAAGDEE
jgi:hypothetical protein